MAAEGGVSAAEIAAEAGRLRRYAAALTQSRADADDLVQDCLEKALEHRTDVRERARLFPWMLAILHNLHSGALRRRRRRGHDLPVEDFADTLALSAPPGERTAWRDFARAVGGLPEEQRQVLLLNALEGLSYREVADALDVPVGTVMSRLARARERLRVALEGGGQRVIRRVP
jgi:RNA polymerase sigma-70 factor (ECF subfamily)